MTTTYPLTIDSFDTHVDNVDDVMAADVNNLNDAVVALETWHRDAALMRLKNTSGSTVAANDVGYIDDAGEFKLTTTAYLDVSWAVVVEGAANNSDIIVARRGLVTVICNGNAAIGDYLYTSTTTKQAQPQSYTRPEMFAVVKTANASGAGGTCVALLLCGTTVHTTSSANDVIQIASSPDSDFVAKIDAGGTGGLTATNVPYDNIASGADTVIKPAAATELGKQRLYNITRSNYRLISDVDTGNDNITTVSSSDDWADNDDITIVSQTCFVGGAIDFVDVDLSEASAVTAIPTHARHVIISGLKTDSGAGNELLSFHPWSTYALKSQLVLYAQVANIQNSMSITLPLIQRRFCWRYGGSGAATSTQIARLAGYTLATP